MGRITLVLFIVVIGAACGGGDDSGSAGITASPTIVASDFAYDQDVIDVQAGSEVIVELRNVGSLEHTWTVLQAGVAVTTGEEVMPDQVIAVMSARSIGIDSHVRCPHSW